MTRILLSTVTLGLAAGAAVGCVDLDEKLITGVSSQYYSSPDGLNSAVIASYSQLRGFYGREQLLSLTQVGTDTWMAADQSGSNNKNFDSYDGGLNSQVAPLANTWNPAYQAINTLNAAIVDRTHKGFRRQRRTASLAKHTFFARSTTSRSCRSSAMCR